MAIAPVRTLIDVASAVIVTSRRTDRVEQIGHRQRKMRGLTRVSTDRHLAVRTLFSEHHQKNGKGSTTP
jgi:hypothetical protein